MRGSNNQVIAVFVIGEGRIKRIGIPRCGNLCAKSGSVPAAHVHGPFDGVLHKLAGIAEAKFFLDASLVSLDGLHAEVQFVRNLAGPVAFADESEDFQFAVR